MSSDEAYTTVVKRNLTNKMENISFFLFNVSDTLKAHKQKNRELKINLGKQNAQS